MRYSEKLVSRVRGNARDTGGTHEREYGVGYRTNASLLGNAQSIVIPVKTGIQFYLVRIGREVGMLEERLPWA